MMYKMDNEFLPEQFDKYSLETQQSILSYLDQLGEKEKKAYMIAKTHLGSSFHLLKSIGYLEWKKKQSTK